MSSSKKGILPETQSQRGGVAGKARNIELLTVQKETLGQQHEPNKHSIDFSNQPYRCDECQITSAYQADLDLHLDCATRGRCGFTFLHQENSSTNRTHSCTGSGQHPPNGYFNLYDSHTHTCKGCCGRGKNVNYVRIGPPLLVS